MFAVLNNRIVLFSSLLERKRERERQRERRNINRGLCIFITFLSLVLLLWEMRKMETCYTNKYSFIFISDRNYTLHHIVYIFSFHSFPSCSSYSLFLNRFLWQTGYHLVPVRYLRNVPRSGNTQTQPLGCKMISASSQLEIERKFVTTRRLSANSRWTLVIR
jgi:hypothetical protein